MGDMRSAELLWLISLKGRDHPQGEERIIFEFILGKQDGSM
jgi:hypothetical protein